MIIWTWLRILAYFHFKRGIFCNNTFEIVKIERQKFINLFISYIWRLILRHSKYEWSRHESTCNIVFSFIFSFIHILSLNVINLNFRFINEMNKRNMRISHSKIHWIYFKIWIEKSNGTITNYNYSFILDLFILVMRIFWIDMIPRKN